MSSKAEDRKANVGKEEVDKVGVVLDELPVKPNISAREAVGLLKEKIANAQKKGYTLSEIQEMMASNGIPISLSTLRGYVRVGEPKGEKGSSGRKKKANARRGSA